MAKYRILVVDDARVIRLSLKNVFEKFDCEVLELGNAEDLFQSDWKYQKLDLLFLDIDLPGMDGLTALEKIKQIPHLANVPVIMLTGHSDPNKVRQAISRGVTDYIRKPFTADSLLKRARIILDLPESTGEGAPESLPAAEESLKKPTLYAVVNFSPAAQIPSEFAALLQPSSESGLIQAGPVILIIPFEHSGSQDEASAAISSHLQQQNLAADAFKITATPPLKE